MKARKIPKTDSIEELARFWDTHDMTDFEDQLEDVPDCVFERKPETVIPVRLRRHEVEAVKRVAKTRGVREAALLRQWVREKLQDAESSVGSARATLVPPRILSASEDSGSRLRNGANVTSQLSSCNWPLNLTFRI